jgi:glutaredoxin-like YruB-family protein
MKNVIVYSTPTCPYCIRLKEYLRSKNIPFQNLDVGSNEDARSEMLRKSGQMGVPVIDIEGKIIIGFDKKTVNKELGLA